MNRRELIIRAWKDPRYRASLSTEERAALPESPAGQSMAELEESQLDQAVGGGLPGGGIITSPIRCRTVAIAKCGPTLTWVGPCPPPPVLE
ncbi:mersacidin/lichenicidin family type 2 lantibiotic [Archangium lipolyticum]|uniref:mersacidin/lichenicidin family type 2 lantibiotic n=1 Tax=Archangium lipolyticum TaxID=2970465 RepID=UPI00214A7149|nr:mersacidin/lichenicidin family type 2 lantibiotic [Archangium lipolyticum]